MADKKQVSFEQVNTLLEALAKEENNPKNLASKIGDKDSLSDRRVQIREFLNTLEPEDSRAKEALSSLKNRTDRSLKTAASQYVSNKNPNPTNFDQLNEGKAIKIAAQSDAAKILENQGSQIDPLEYRLQQNMGKATPNIMDVQKMDVAGAKKQAIEGLLMKPNMPAAKGKMGGKLGALAALGGLGYSALKGEPVMAQDVFKAGAEAINPLPFSLEEIKDETSKLDPMRAVAKYKESQEADKMAREEAALPGALEFGDKLDEMQQNQPLEQNMSPRRAEVLKRMSSFK
jgi:hypothetical protein